MVKQIGVRDSCWPLCSEEPTDQRQTAAAAFSFIGFLLKFFGEEGGPSDINTVEYIKILPRECFRQEALTLPCITWEFSDCLSASFLICHWGMAWVQLLQAGPDAETSSEMCLHGRWAGLDLFSAVALFWRSCSSFNQFKAVLVASASNDGVLFFRNPGTRFCSGADVKKLGFRLDFLLTVAVKCVSATDLRTTLDPSQGPLEVLLSVSPLKAERLCPAKWENSWENQEGCFSQLLLASAQSWCSICHQDTAPGRILSGELAQEDIPRKGSRKAVC